MGDAQTQWVMKAVFGQAVRTCEQQPARSNEGAQAGAVSDLTAAAVEAALWDITRPVVVGSLWVVVAAKRVGAASDRVEVHQRELCDAISESQLAHN